MIIAEDNKIIKFLLVALLTVGMLSAQVWDGTTDLSWYNETDNAFTINSAEELAGLAELVNGNTLFVGKTITLSKSIDLDAKNWTPIGDSLNQFFGVFNGNGNSISNLSVSNFKYSGLFGYLGAGATIKNLVVNVNSIKTVSAGNKENYAGGITAAAYGGYNWDYYIMDRPVTIENCGVNIKDSISAKYAGGMIGISDNSGSKGATTIKNSYATGKVVANCTAVRENSIASYADAGGFVGHSNDIIIENSYTTCNVYANATTSQPITVSMAYAGGFVGMTWGGVGEITIINSYTTGNISAYAHSSYPPSNAESTSGAGGFAGNPGSDLDITNSYASGIMTATGNGKLFTGGIAGNNWHRGINISVYYNSDGTNNVVGSVYGKENPTGITGLTSDELRQQSTFVDWDFEKIWAIDDTKNNGFPYLDLRGSDTPIQKIQKSDNRYGIRFSENIVSDKAEISVILPNSEKTAEMKVFVYDNISNIVFSKNVNSNKVSWDLTNNAGRFVANGTYLVVVEAKSVNRNIYRYSAKIGVKR